MAPTPTPGHLPQTSEQASRSLQRFATQRVSFTFNCSRTSHLHPGAPLLPSPRPSTHKQKFKCTGMFGFDFFFTPELFWAERGPAIPQAPCGDVGKAAQEGAERSGRRIPGGPRRAQPRQRGAGGRIPQQRRFSLHITFAT